MRQLYSFYSDAFWIAFKSIMEHKLRAFLTLIGIIIGVAAVVVVGASISGLKTYVIGQVSKVLGSNHFMITRMAQVGDMSDEEWERMNRRNKDVTWEEFEYVRDQCRLCSYVGAQMNAGADLKEGTAELPATRMIGVTDNMYEIEDKTLTTGRFFSAEEVNRSAKVAVIGSDVAEKFFEFTNPVGKTLKIRGVPVEIIGVEQKRGSFFGQSQDRHVYIPITLHNQIFNRTGGIQIHGKTVESETFKAAIDEAHLILRNKRRLLGSEESTFSVVNVDEFNSTMDQITGAIAAVVIPITMIILVVGGIVVMNIMLVSVTERTFEVGLRKAIGASRQQILLQFLIESALLCVVGGLLGLILAVGATQLVGYLLDMTMTITIGYVILSVGVSSVIGIIAGLYPAWKASRLDPIVALTQS
ncbi:ABC transporter permease [Leptolyngbya sp. 7M]|uniref:ABC transporter permease n=1 Tax=Leptolyngbya sp. 7M TaxID=2812896 RepID=UPI001B8AB912|nr:ABC transporter permease [Leptolyngbya sp. 7M]QYO67365.1 ABC transporter permease [Leptolyngbya sp. 7M]